MKNIMRLVKIVSDMAFGTGIPAPPKVIKVACGVAPPIGLDGKRTSTPLVPEHDKCLCATIDERIKASGMQSSVEIEPLRMTEFGWEKRLTRTTRHDKLHKPAKVGIKNTLKNGKTSCTKRCCEATL